MTTSKRRAASFIAEQLETFGVTHVFMVPAVLRRTLAEIERHTSIVAVHTHGEKSAAYMADGYARVARHPAVCMAQQVGALNLAAGLRDATLASSPVVAFTGGSPPLHGRTGLYQAADDLPAFDQYTKFNERIDDVAEIPTILETAFKTAASGNPGPVHVQFQGQEGEIDQVEAEFPAVAEMCVTPSPELDPAKLDLIARRLAGAERPMILSGGGVLKAGAGAAVRELSRRARIPIATSLSGRGLVAETDDLALGVTGTYSRESANRVAQEADVVLVLGSGLGSMVTNFWRMPTTAADVLRIDIDPSALNANFSPSVSLAGDLCEAVDALVERADVMRRERTEWLDHIAERKANWLDQRRPLVMAGDAPIRPERLCAELTSALPDDGVLVVDTGHAGMWMASMFELTAPTQTYIRSAGHLGWAFSAALGAKCAAPHRPVVAFTGDLGFWYHIAEIETAVRHGINTVTVVNNNHSGNQSRRGFIAAYDGEETERARSLWVQREVDFAAVATEIGALGIRVEQPNGIAGAIQRGLASGRPTVIDVVTDIDAAAPMAWDPDGWVQSY